MNAIEIDNVSFSYDKVNVFNQISLTIESGDYVGIIGSNGAGKSTLLKLILGLLKPTNGRIRLFGKEGSVSKDFQKIGYIPQNSASLLGEFPATAEEIVKANLYSQTGFLRFPKKKYAGLVNQALKVVGMQDCSKRMIGELSGGQQQRIMIAQMLVASPQVLLLDEPTTGIDADAAVALYTLLKQLNQEHGITVMMVTHDVERVARSAKRLLRLNKYGLREEPHDL